MISTVVEFDFGLQKYVVLDTGKTVTYIVIDRRKYKIDIIKKTRRITMNLETSEMESIRRWSSSIFTHKTYRCLWNVISKMQQFTWTIINTSLTSNAHDCGGTLSRKTSGSGPYISLLGKRSWTRDKDTVAKVIFAAKITNAGKIHTKIKWNYKYRIEKEELEKVAGNYVFVMELDKQQFNIIGFQAQIFMNDFFLQPSNTDDACSETCFDLLTDECFPFFFGKARLFSAGHVHFYHNSVPICVILVIRQIVIFIRYFLQFRKIEKSSEWVFQTSNLFDREKFSSEFKASIRSKREGDKSKRTGQPSTAINPHTVASIHSAQREQNAFHSLYMNVLTRSVNQTSHASCECSCTRVIMYLYYTTELALIEQWAHSISVIVVCDVLVEYLSYIVAMHWTALVALNDTLWPHHTSTWKQKNPEYEQRA